MKTLIKVILFILLLQAVSVTAQDKKALNWKKRVFFGGNFSLSIGSITWIEVSPLIGYRITPRLSSGTGFTYVYFGKHYGNINFNTSIYGGKVFSTFTVIKDIGKTMNILNDISFFLHGEYEVLSIEKQYFYDPRLTGRMNIQNVWMGFGLKQRMGGNSGIYLMILWNMANNMYSPYSSPVLRAGFLF